jgi:antitoxin ParD1/3/4
LREKIMGATRSLSITLPADLADLVEAWVASEHYASASEVIEDSLSSLRERNAQLEHWLRTEVVATYDAHIADPSTAIPLEDVIGRFEARFAAAKTERR